MPLATNSHMPPLSRLNWYSSASTRTPHASRISIKRRSSSAFNMAVLLKSSLSHLAYRRAVLSDGSASTCVGASPINSSLPPASAKASSLSSVVDRKVVRDGTITAS